LRLYESAIASRFGFFAKIRNPATFDFCNTIKQKADLPQPVLALIAKVEPMADVGEPFEMTDALIGPPLPFQRFIAAQQSGCDLAINYEQGGRGYSHGLILLRQIGGDWMVRHGSSYPYSRLERIP
jgi:hypothetical protein